jgi:hypothetical protein
VHASIRAGAEGSHDQEIVDIRCRVRDRHQHERRQKYLWLVDCKDSQTPSVG